MKHWAEQWLQERRTYNRSHQCSPSESSMIDRMLAPENKAEMHLAFDDIAKKVPHYTHRLVILDVVLGTLSLFDPERIRETKQALARIEEINCRMFDLLEELAELHDERADLGNRYGITTPDDTDIGQWIESALYASDPHTRCRGESWLLPELRKARSFDGKYWPSASDMLYAMAQAQISREAEPRIIDSPTAAAIKGYTGQRAILRALWAAINDAAGSPVPTDARDEDSLSEPVPKFKPTDRTMAALASLVTDDEVTEDNVKRARQALTSR